MSETPSSPTTPESRFLRAIRRQPVDCTPVWLMRQAGRYMPEYRALRAKHGMLELVRTPDLAAEITLQPVEAFGVDAAIIFADILTLLDGMGLGLEFVAGEGPLLRNPIRSAADVDRLVVRPAEETLGTTLEAIRLVRQRLNGRLPLIGFSGAPFTLACYAIEGGGSKAYATALAFMREQRGAWHRLLDKLAQAVGEYLRAQVDAGAQVLQLFDSWAGLLAPEDYRDHVMPHSARALRIARMSGWIPVIHFATRSGPLLPLLRQAGGDVIGVDSSTPIDEARRVLGPTVPLQGNLDPDLLVAPGDEWKRQAAGILDRMRGQPGHIFNLGHGVQKETDPARVAELVAFVHEYSKSGG